MGSDATLQSSAVLTKKRNSRRRQLADNFSGRLDGFDAFQFCG